MCINKIKIFLDRKMMTNKREYPLSRKFRWIALHLYFKMFRKVYYDKKFGLRKYLNKRNYVREAPPSLGNGKVASSS